MVSAIRASSHARDFTTTALAEPFFRAVAHRTLTAMLADPAFISNQPHLWRDTLRFHGLQIELLKAVKKETAEILALVRDLHAIKKTTVPEITLIAITRKISPPRCGSRRGPARPRCRRRHRRRDAGAGRSR